MGSPKKSATSSVKAKGKSAAASATPKKSAAPNVAKVTKPPKANAAPDQLSAGDWFEKLVAIQKRLRDPGGCPWDIEQTHQT